MLILYKNSPISEYLYGIGCYLCDVKISQLCILWQQYLLKP